MKGLPIRRAQFATADFAAWLARQGAEVGTPTNPYEVIRYRAFWNGGSKAATHVVYAKENGLLTFTSGSREHYEAFVAGGSLAIPATPQKQPQGDGASKAEKMRRKLIARDGDGCWFCGGPLGDDQTLEHLVPKSKGGLNGLANYVLAHKACNALAADKPLVEKIEMRARMRTEREALS